MTKKQNDDLPNAFDTPAPEPKPEPMLEKAPDEPVGAVGRLRAYEDEMLGPDAVRIGGKIERGVGSPYADMTDEQRAKYEALERLIVSEQKLADAHAALVAADAEHEAAEAAVK